MVPSECGPGGKGKVKDDHRHIFRKTDMKILLINPPSEYMIRASLPPVVEDSTGFYPPLGLLYVAAYAEDVEGCEVKLLDCDAQGIHHSDLFEMITAFRPDVVGIQAMTFTLIDAVEVARAAKKAAPDALIVMGGPHPTLYPEETISIPEVDVIIRGEGEYTFQALLKALQSGRSPASIYGALTKDKNTEGYPCLEKLDYIQDLDELKMPARHLLDLSRYFSSLVAPRRITTMMSSRGCPGKCVFCDRPQMGKVFRKRSAESVVKEMTHCVRDLCVKEIIFYDDTFTIDRERVIEICDRITGSGLKVNWDIRARVDTMTPQMISKLRQAGCVRIHYGVETGSPRLQKLIRKNLSLDKVREVFTLTRKAGIETLGYFMIGLPTEGRAEVEETMKMVLSLPMDYAHIATFTPYPGTVIYREALESGFYDRDYWREFARAPDPHFTPRYWNEHFTDAQLLDLLKDAYYQFYSRPGYMLQRLIKVRSPGEFLRKASLGVKLLREVSSLR